MPRSSNLLLFFLRYGLRGMHLASNNNKQTHTYNIIHDDVPNHHRYRIKNQDIKNLRHTGYIAAEAG